MPLEQEVKGMLIVGFTIIMGIAVLITLLLWVKNRNTSAGYVLMLLHFGLFSGAAYFLFKGIFFDINHPMASEEISLRIGFAGVAWSLSMFCLVMGIFNFSKIKKNNAF